MVAEQKQTEKTPKGSDLPKQKEERKASKTNETIQTKSVKTAQVKSTRRKSKTSSNRRAKSTASSNKNKAATSSKKQLKQQDDAVKTAALFDEKPKGQTKATSADSKDDSMWEEEDQREKEPSGRELGNLDELTRTKKLDGLATDLTQTHALDAKLRKSIRMGDPTANRPTNDIYVVSISDTSSASMPSGDLLDDLVSNEKDDVTQASYYGNDKSDK